MPEAKSKNGNFLQFLILFVVVYLGSQLLIKSFVPQTPQGPGEVKLTIANITVGHHPVLTVRNGTASGVVIPARCPLPPADVLFKGSGQTLVPVSSSETAAPCVPDPVSVTPGGSVQISLAPWKYSIFGGLGAYEVHLPVYANSGAVLASKPLQTLSANFALTEPGSFTKLFRALITRPFLNFLIFIASVAPDHNLGLAIVLLTLAVKILLFFPTQHALEGQKKLQLLQPKLAALQKQYKDDPKRLQEETLKLWKEHKVNPFQSCLPTLVQFPVLIGLLYVIRDDSNLALSRDLIYPAYQHLSWHFGTHFLGIDLLKPEIYVFPVLLVLMQFFQMKLAFMISKRKKAKDTAASSGQNDAKKDVKPDATQQMQEKMMLYLLPLMIGYFAFKFPAAVSLYWGISTLFAIGQQMLVNREHLRV